MAFGSRLSAKMKWIVQSTNEFCFQKHLNNRNIPLLLIIHGLGRRAVVIATVADVATAVTLHLWRLEANIEIGNWTNLNNVLDSQ